MQGIRGSRGSTSISVSLSPETSNQTLNVSRPLTPGSPLKRTSKSRNLFFHLESQDTISLNSKIDLWKSKNQKLVAADDKKVEGNRDDNDQKLATVNNINQNPLPANNKRKLETTNNANYQKLETVNNADQKVLPVNNKRKFETTNKTNYQTVETVNNNNIQKLETVYKNKNPILKQVYSNNNEELETIVNVFGDEELDNDQDPDDQEAEEDEEVDNDLDIQEALDREAAEVGTAVDPCPEDEEAEGEAAAAAAVGTDEEQDAGNNEAQADRVKGVNSRESLTSSHVSTVIPNPSAKAETVPPDELLGTGDGNKSKKSSKKKGKRPKKKTESGSGTTVSFAGQYFTIHTFYKNT